MLLTAAAWRANAQTVNGNIVGTVRDQQGAVMPSINVVAKNLETAVERTATSDEGGAFTIPGLPAGNYDVTVSTAGFETEIRRNVTLTVGGVVHVAVALKVGAVTDKVEVTGEAPQVETTNATISGLVSDSVIRELPLNGRDWLQLAVLQSGVLTVDSQAGNSSPAKGLGVKMSISGGRPTQNVFRVDGLVVNDSTNDSPGSAMGVNMGVDAIREFSVLTNSYTAEYGRSSGGVVNAISKSGSNSYHGTAFEFLRNSALDARNFFDLAIPPFRRNQFGGAVGGPIKKDKLFFFGNYEGLRQVLGRSSISETLSPNAKNGLICANPPSCTSNTQITIDPKIKPYLALFPAPNGAIQGDTGQYIVGAPQTGDENYATWRVDYQINSSTSLFGSYLIDRANLATPDAFAEKLTGTQTSQNRAILTLQHTFTPTILNTLRGGFMRSVNFSGFDYAPASSLLTDVSLGFIPGIPMGTFAINGLSSPGGIGSTGGDKYWYTTPQLSDDVSWIKGRNNMRIGFSVEAIQHNAFSPSSPNGTWQFGSVSDFLTGNNAQQFSADFPGTNAYRGFREKIFGIYFQDDFRLRSNLTLNFGMRYEPTTEVAEVNGLVAILPTLSSAQPRIGNGFYKNPSSRDFEPRVGLAWDPFKDGKTSVRAGFGVFDVLILPNLIHLRALRAAPFFLAGNLTNPPASSYPNDAFQLLGPNGYRALWVQSNPPVGYKMQWNLNIQHQLTNSLSLMAGYVGAKGVHLPDGSDDADMIPPSLVTTAPDGHLLFPSTRPYQRINPNYSQIQAIRWDGYSIYHSLQVNLAQRLSHGFTFQAAYVYSKSIDNGDIEYSNVEISGQMDNPWWFNTNLQKGVSDFNIPQHLSLNFVWDVPSLRSGWAVSKFLLSGWEVTGIFTDQSGRPFSIRIPNDQAGTGSNQVGRNGGGQRPDFNPNGGPGCSVGAVNSGDPYRYIRVECFSVPLPGELGNLGRNTFQAPSLQDFDFSLFKNNNVFTERLKVQFRTEMFNVLNHANFTNGNQPFTPFNTQGLAVPANTQLISTATTSRQIQFGVKFVF
jgi:hypothetical protein